MAAKFLARPPNRRRPTKFTSVLRLAPWSEQQSAEAYACLRIDTLNVNDENGMNSALLPCLAALLFWDRTQGWTIRGCVGLVFNSVRMESGTLRYSVVLITVVYMPC